MNEINKNLRKQIYDIVLYTEGAFSVKELYHMPLYHTTEIIESFSDKNTKEKEAIEAASGKKTF
jgi:hypothetical protein|tara:strand:- start:18 stop:209 length:192 start_codon:yes stop_codon:yes gene_type:complete